MNTAHCSLGYHILSVLKLETFAAGVRTGIYSNNPPFVAPPFTAIQMDALIESYHHTYDDYKNGGKLKKPFYLAAKAALIKALDDTASYVDELPALTEEIILMGGYVPTKNYRFNSFSASYTPQGATLTRGGGGELLAEVPKIEGAESYGCIVFAGNPLPAEVAFNTAGQLVVTANNNSNANPTPDPTGIVAVFDMTKSRKKRFTGLKNGYYLLLFTFMPPMPLG